MAFKFNVFTGTFDLVTLPSSNTSEFDLILTGYNAALDLEVLIDQNGNVLVGV